MEKWLKHFWRSLRLQHTLLVLHPGNNNPYKLLLPIKKYTYEHNATSPDITICTFSMYTQLQSFTKNCPLVRQETVNHSPHHSPNPASTPPSPTCCWRHHTAHFSQLWLLLGISVTVSLSSILITVWYSTEEQLHTYCQMLFVYRRWNNQSLPHMSCFLEGLMCMSTI